MQEQEVTTSPVVVLASIYHILTPTRYAMDVVRECAEAWERLMTGKTQPGNIST
jgi:hypothetical protein